MDQEYESTGLGFEETREILYPKFGDIFGDSEKRLRELLPLTQAEIDQLLRSRGETWAYALKVLEALRRRSKGQEKKKGTRTRQTLSAFVREPHISSKLHSANTPGAE